MPNKVYREIHLWTDGSAVSSGIEKGLGGYGFALLYGDFREVDITLKYCSDAMMLTGFKGCTGTTNQREEMKSCIEGLKRLNRTDIQIQVWADSAYLINCMNKRWYDNWRINGWKNSKKQPVANQDLWEELLEIIESNMLFINFGKVKGHSKVHYNELCDQLARNGLNEAREMVKESVK